MKFLQSLFSIKLKSILLFILIIVPLYNTAQNKLEESKKIILILGSDDLKTLTDRVNIGARLYKTSHDFDYVIVSGGCGAHKSKICEATEMASLLVEKGIPKHKIIKEEKSQNTVQNYIYSRSLKMSDGTKYINSHDSLYVVSNHWHAISVAARFNTYDKVNAVYHIEGSIIPSSTDKVDYVDIYYKNNDNEDFIRKGLWPSVQSAFSIYDYNKDNKRELINYFVTDTLLAFHSFENKDSGLVLSSTEVLPVLPDDWIMNIDASYYSPVENKIYLFNQNKLLRFSPSSKSIDKGYPMLFDNWVENMSSYWKHGNIDAAFFNPKSKRVCLFKGDEYLEISSSGELIKEFPDKIINVINHWPFEWGTGDIDAAVYSNIEKKIYLYRGREYICVSLDNKVESDTPQRIKLENPNI